VTGDHEVFLFWLENTEADVAGYRIYQSPCESGGDCLYVSVGATDGTEFRLSGLANGVTSYFAVTAIDRAGNESKLSREVVFDTPRPEGFGVILSNSVNDPSQSGFDFSGPAIRPFDDPQTDVYFEARNGVLLMLTPFTDTDIQDAGYASSLDAVDFAPSGGWSPSGSVELVVGHCYVVGTHDNHYAKLRVTAADASRIQIDWAYQVDPGNRELKARPVTNGPRIRRPRA